MSEKPIRKARPAIIFGQKCVKNVGYIDDYIFACEIVGGDHITYSKPRRTKYHLVILVLDGTLRIIINGNEHIFTKNTYVNLPTWADIYEIEYDDDFKAMTTATDKAVVEDIFPTHNGGPGAAVFKQIPDAGPVGAQQISSFVDHFIFLLTSKHI